MEISAEKTKLMTNNTCGINTSQASSTLAHTTDEGSKPEILSRIAQTTAALTRLKPVWNDRSIPLSSKIRLMRSLVTPIFLYACESWLVSWCFKPSQPQRITSGLSESWALTADLQRRILAMEMRCYRKILRISYKDRVTNEEVRDKTKQAIGPHEDLPTIVKRRKLQWYGHISRSSGLA